jgi:hypothetical protein
MGRVRVTKNIFLRKKEKRSIGNHKSRERTGENHGETQR